MASRVVDFKLQIRARAQLPARMLQEGVMLHRIVPWLWRLADEEDTTRPDVILQERLLEALRLCPAADEIKVMCWLLEARSAGVVIWAHSHD